MKFMNRWESEDSNPTSLTTTLSYARRTLDVFVASQYVKVQSDQSLRTPSGHSSKCPFHNFLSSHPLALRTQFYIVFDGKRPCNTKKPQGLI